jgi:hypothetical protein
MYNVCVEDLNKSITGFAQCYTQLVVWVLDNLYVITSLNSHVSSYNKSPLSSLSYIPWMILLIDTNYFLVLT